MTQKKIVRSRRDYNGNRLQSQLDKAMPEEFAAQVEPGTSELNRDFKAAKNGLHI